MQKVRLALTGSSPLLVHADRLADPLDPATRELQKVTKKTKKTEDDQLAIARMEFAAGLYYADGRPVIPTRNIAKSLIEGARVTRAGAKIERGLVMIGTEVPIIYDGPRDIQGLYEARFYSRMTVRIAHARNVRVRPQFKEWSLEAFALLNTEVIDAEDLTDVATNAGELIGIGDYRKGGFGRFTASVVKL